MRVVLLLGLAFFSGCVMFNKVDFSELFSNKMKFRYVGGARGAKAKLVVLPLHGLIVGSEKSFSMDRVVSPSYVESALAQIHPEVKIAALVLDINSRGGSGAASEEILAKIQAFKKERNIPVVAYYGDMATSGAYYISQAADYIVANPNSVTGSIGVIVMFPRVDQFLKNKLDIEMITFKSGKFKDSGSAFRKMTREEQNYWQKLTLMYYDRFVEVVANGRKLSTEQVKEISQGQAMHPKFALENKLIDRIGTFDIALAAARDLSKMDPGAIEHLRISSQPKLPSSVRLNTALDGVLPSFQSSSVGYNGAVWYIH